MKKNNLLIPVLALVDIPQLQNSNFKIMPLRSPQDIEVGANIMKIAFGGIDCRKEFSPEHKAANRGYSYYHDKTAITKYGSSKMFSKFVDRNALMTYATSEAFSRDFDEFLYYISGENDYPVKGMYSCLGDSGSTSLALHNGKWHVVGVHRGGKSLSKGFQNDQPTPFKLEYAVRIDSPRVCQFSASLAQEYQEPFKNICQQNQTGPYHD